MTTARHKAIDQIRRRVLAESKRDHMISFLTPDESAPVPMDTLRLIFTCCHPALALETQVALTLRTVGGLTTEEIARAFCAPVTTVAQRLVRAKTKIRDAGIPYIVPDEEKRVERLPAVLAVIYLIFNEGYSSSGGDYVVRADLCGEALRLARQLMELLPEESEVKGLLGLMLLTDARRDTREDSHGDLVLLEDQDRSRWDRLKIKEGVSLVEASLQGSRPGSYGVQGAIAALHAQAPSMRETDWKQIVALYGVLEAIHPSPVIALNRAVAVAMAYGPEKGLELLEGVLLPGYHLLPATRADLLRRLNKRTEAGEAYREALNLVKQPAERRFLERRLREVTVA
ncbi:MAG TPA: sigma factor-like helix-turn-helix DNA-binding protein [Opitutaceae bacterium]|nr:sigma factor-like helix-turn-helix DNA-binding protein [Opitutaceae bacterium]